MDISEAFRRNARECLRQAMEAPNRASRTQWLVMGRTWFDLAESAEEHDTISSRARDVDQVCAALVCQLTALAGTRQQAR